jgi:hypothetical protein
VVEPSEPLHHFAALQVLLNDFRDVLYGNAGIPGAIRMHDHVRPVAAGAERTARGDMYFALELAPGNLSAEFLQHFLGTSRSATSVVIGLAIGADENMVTKRQHHILLLV